MRIDSYTLGMDSARLYKSSNTMRTTYAQTDVSAQGSKDALMSFSDYLGGKEEAKNFREDETPETEKTGKKPDYSEDFPMFRTSGKYVNNIAADRSVFREFQKLHELMIRHIFDLLFGGKSVNESADATELAKIEDDSGDIGRFDMVPVSVKLSEMKFTQETYYEETESTSFRALGQVNTADGRTIDVGLNVEMSRTFTAYSSTQVNLTDLNLCDPLVINFNGNLPGLKSGDEFSFFFDLDADGKEEKISSLGPESAFLALDLNGDGKINDGSELFGPKSGDGFKDLSKYDEDGNGWIDENDEVFEKLKLWVKDPSGEDVLYTLKQKNVGALYLGAAATQFTLADASNAALGYIRQTGLFLYEDGMTGSMQHVDLVS